MALHAAAPARAARRFLLKAAQRIYPVKNLLVEKLVEDDEAKKLTFFTMLTGPGDTIEIDIEGIGVLRNQVGLLSA